MRPLVTMLLVIAAVSGMLLCACTKKHTPGSTTFTETGIQYTALIAGMRSYHHTYLYRSTFSGKQLSFANMKDTAFSFTVVNDARISLGSETFTFMSPFGSNSLDYQDLDQTQFINDEVTFNYVTNTVSYFRSQAAGDTIRLEENFNSF